MNKKYKFYVTLIVEGDRLEDIGELIADGDYVQHSVEIKNLDDEKDD